MILELPSFSALQSGRLRFPIGAQAPETRGRHCRTCHCRCLPGTLLSLSKEHGHLMSRVLQKDAEQESQMRAEIQGMKQELSTVNMMDEFARYARLERKINKMTDKLKTHVKARTAQLAKIKWVISVAFYILQAALMVSLIWKYYSVPVAVVPSKWITPLDRLVAFPTRVAGGVGITCWILVCNKVVAIVLHPFS
ncbi:guided entry of tail-anchored proteins factor 1 isoform X1 [Leopardus geoffroyi]|uniref:guided entry of tail-anchored proteins factor 1 isoform X1 n=1 Tax=Leopardus geoffroyi TaxID=46844 RepID=UPI001E25DB45|nr:guided entry of tail-anchored proteins factor 1 isoform X1 [Leopardus geoffroyi]